MGEASEHPELGSGSGLKVSQLCSAESGTTKDSDPNDIDKDKRGSFGEKQAVQPQSNTPNNRS